MIRQITFEAIIEPYNALVLFLIHNHLTIIISTHEKMLTDAFRLGGVCVAF